MDVGSPFLQLYIESCPELSSCPNRHGCENGYGEIFGYGLSDFLGELRHLAQVDSPVGHGGSWCGTYDKVNLVDNALHVGGELKLSLPVIPFLRFSMILGSELMHVTCTPISAKQVALTSPTVPVPTTAIFISFYIFF